MAKNRKNKKKKEPERSAASHVWPVEWIGQGKYGLILVIPFLGQKKLSDEFLVANPKFLCSFSGIAKAWNQAYFGEGSGPILLDEVRCTGNELSIEQCPKSSWGEHNCDHKEDAGVSCTPLTGKSFTPLIYQHLPPAPSGLTFSSPQFR